MILVVLILMGDFLQKKNLELLLQNNKMFW